MRGEAVTVVVGAIGKDQNGGDGLKLLFLLPLSTIVQTLARGFQHPQWKELLTMRGSCGKGKYINEVWGFFLSWRTLFWGADLYRLLL